MPQPTPGDQHVDSLLTNVSVAFIQRAENFVADRAFPRVPVQKQSSLFATYSREDFLRDEMKRRAPGSASAGGGYNVSTDTYNAEVWALHKAVDEQSMANADAPFTPMRDATNWVTSRELLKREVEWASTFMAASTWTGSSTGSDISLAAAPWDDASSTPIENVTDESVEVEAKTGFLPNTIIMNRRVWSALKNHPDIVDRTKHTSANSVTTELVARLFGLDQVLVTGAAINSAQEGATASYDYIVGNSALLCYSAPSASLEMPSAGYTFVWSGLTGSAEGRRIKRWYEDARASEIVEIEAAWDQKVVSSVMGVYFTNCVS